MTPSSTLAREAGSTAPAAATDLPAGRDLERWIIPIIVCATTSIVLGAIWDISWHMTIGRDSLWSPPHLLEQLGAATAGIVCGAYVIWLTFLAPGRYRERTVRFWGFQGPLGAWVCIWGALVMIASLPFDNWWHNAYGLDVQILSPPHAVLMIGVLGIQFGTLLFALAAQNRAGIQSRIQYGRVYTFAVGVLILMVGLAHYEEIGYANEWHASAFYQKTALLFPFLLLGVARVSPLRWPATAAAASYMAVLMGTMWVLQLVPAEPRLAPIYNPVTHMVPLAFPLVLIAPALLIDIIERRRRGRNDWVTALLAGISFVVVMVLVHWPFASFMLTPAARNHFFGADIWPYMYQPGDWQHEFWRLDLESDGSWSPLAFGTGLVVAVFLGTMSARLGLLWGGFARKVVR